MIDTVEFIGHDSQHNVVSGTHDVAVNCPPSAVAGQGYEVVFVDDFDTLDENVWDSQAWYAGGSWDVFNLNAVHVADSILTLTCRGSQDYPPVELATVGLTEAPSYPRRPDAKVWQEGYFEVKCRYTNDPYTRPWVGFFSHESANCWPDQRDCGLLASEWDLMENGIGNLHADTRAWMVLHRNTGGTCGVLDDTRNVSLAGDGFSNWHVWGGKWTADEVMLYLDDQLIGRVTAFDSTAQPMFMTLAVNANPSTPPPPTPRLPEYKLEVDWVRVWEKP